VWDAVSGRELLTLRGHGDSVVGVVFSPDGRRLATAGDDYTAKMWAVVSGQELLILHGHAGAVLVWPSVLMASDSPRQVKTRRRNSGTFPVAGSC
jgi:WD40 repeat protein